MSQPFTGFMSQPFTPQIAVPAYFDSSHTGDYATLKSAAPAVAIAVLDVGISSANPPDVQDPSLQAFWGGIVQSYQAVGIAVLGYIDTNDGVGAAPGVPTRDGSPQGPIITQDDICGKPGQPGYIDQWYILCPTIDGIFFDEGPASYRFTGDPNSTTIAQNVKGFYHAIYTCVQTKPVRTGHPNLGGNAGPTVLLNASEYSDADGWWIMQNTSASPFKACDIAILFERDWDRYLNHYSPGTWWTNYPPERIVHVIYGCPETNVSQAIQLSKQRGAGYIYIYDIDAANYNRLPPYWNEEVSAVLAGGTAGRLSLVGAMTISPTAPTTGQAVTASYTVQNTGGQALTVPVLFVGARDPNGANVDFGYVQNVTLQSGQQYAFQQAHTFATAGTYTVWPADYLNGTYEPIDPNSAPVQFTVQMPSPGQLSLVGAMTISPTTPTIGQAVTASYTVQNTGGQALTVPVLFVGARDPNGANVDFGYVQNVTLQPGQQYAFQQAHTFATAGTYTAWPAEYLNNTYEPIDPTTPPVHFTVQSAVNAHVSVVGPTVKVRPTDQPSGTSGAQLLAARNEFESFQIVIGAGSSALQSVNVTLSAPLSGPGIIPASNVTIYREDYYNVVVPSDREGAPGLWPDVLIPAVDPLLGEHRHAFPIDVPAGENRVAWVDVLIPQNAVVGTYSGSITVTAMNFNVIVPIHLTVFNATLPSTASLQSAFALGWDDVCIAKYGQSCFNLNPPNEEEGWRLNALLARAALNNRITISNPQYQPLNAGNLQFFRTYILPLLNGTDPTTRLPGARLTSFQVDTGASLAAWKNEAQLQGFADRAFVYACDEPLNDATKWNACQQQASNAHAVWADVPILVTASIQNANQFNATGYVNWLVCIVEQMDDKPTGDPTYVGNQRGKYDAFLGLNPINRVWLYTSCESYGCDPNTTCQSSPIGSATNDPYFDGWPGYAIDEPASEGCAMGWLSFLYDTTGELYYDVTHCLSSAWTAQYASGGNGDGTLFYPGNPQTIDGTDWIPLESMRLKLIRDGYENYEYLKILVNSGQEAAARQIAQGLFANMYTTNRSDADVQAARHQLAHLIDPVNVP